MLLIFDWDGTVIDSTGKIIRCIQAAIEVNGLPYRDAVAVQNIIGLGLPEAIRELFPAISARDIECLREAYARVFKEEDRVPCSFFPGVEETFGQLREAGHSLAVATGKSRRGLSRVLANLDMADFFDSTRCADETQSKPHPQMLIEILEELDYPAEEAVMVGDTEFDLKMAQNAGVAGIAVSYGAHSLERLQVCEPVLSIDRFDSLLSWDRL